MSQSAMIMQEAHLHCVFLTLLVLLFSRIIENMWVFVVPNMSCPVVYVCIGRPQKPQEEWEMGGGGTAAVSLMTSQAALPLAETGGCRVYKAASSILQGSITILRHSTPPHWPTRSILSTKTLTLTWSESLISLKRQPQVKRKTKNFSIYSLNI